MRAGRRTSGGERAPWGRSEERRGPSLAFWSCPVRERCSSSHPQGEAPIRDPRQRWCGQPHPPRHYGYAREHHGRCARRGAAPAAPRGAAGGRVVVARGGLRRWCSSPTAATLAVWWGAHARDAHDHLPRARRRLAGVRLDLGDADVEIDGGAAAVEVRRVDRFAFGEPSREQRTVERRRAEHQVALPGPGARVLPRDLPGDGARQRAGRDRDLERHRAPVRRARVGAGQTPLGRRSPRPASAASRCARARTPATSAPSRSARPTGSSCARAAATCARSCPPGATRSTRRATPGPLASAG